MTTQNLLALSPRPFTRREKTIIRQDVKRFEKIGRDHGCVTMEDYANFVAERITRDPQGFLTTKAFELVRGLTSYLGEELLHNTTLQRFTGDIEIAAEQIALDSQMFQWTPGWLLTDRFYGQHVFVAMIVADRIFLAEHWGDSLDEILDQIIDWNQGYLIRDEVETRWVTGDDMEPEEYWVA